MSTSLRCTRRAHAICWAGCACHPICSFRSNRMGPEGAKHFADMLTANKTLTSVEYATPHLRPAPPCNRHESVSNR